MLTNFLPILGWLPGYPRKWLRFDLIAGLTMAAVVIPKAMAYAAIAGLTVEVGLYTAFVPMAIYAVMGTSRTLSVSTTTTLAILTAAELGRTVPDGDPARLLTAASTLALLVGAILLLAAILQLGFLANFISDPVLTGFKAGIGLVIVVDQIPKLLGVHFDKGLFFRNIVSIVRHLPETSVPTLLLALLTLALIVGMERRVPQLPAPLFAVVGGVAASGLLGLGNAGIEMVGDVPGGLPAFIRPDLSLFGQLWPGAIGIALMSFVETVAAGRSFARHGDPRPGANQELLALGLANICGGLFRAMPAGGGTSQTAVNSGAGARSQASALVAVAAVVAALLFLAPVIALMPQATLAAVVVATTVGLISPAEFRSILRIRSLEFQWAVAALIGVAVLGTLEGILVAAALSLLAILRQANHPPVYALGRKRHTAVFRPLSEDHPDDETFAGLLIARTEGRLHFANAQRVGDKLHPLIQRAKPRVLVLECSAIPDFEYTALKMLTGFEDKLREAGITLWLVALNPEPLRVIQRAPLGKTLGYERIFPNLHQAVEKYQKSLEPTTHG